MRCQTCDYPLWNLKARQCPECGAAFVPGDFEFNVNSVQFCCPNCEQAYYGTGAKGHLVPSEFNCVKCGQHITMNEMMLRPAGGVVESQTKPQQMPWLERHRIGKVKAWFSMIGLAMTAPGRLMRATPESASVWGAWWFAIVTNFLIVGVLSVPCLCFIVGMPFMMGGFGGGGRAMGAGVGQVAGPLAAMVLATFGIGVVFVFFWGAVSHGILRMTGATSSGIARTFTAICYSSGANALTATPCVGQYIGWIWWIVSAVIMVKEGQKVSGGRAAFAVLTLPIGLLLTIVGGYIAFFAMMATTIGPSPGAPRSYWSYQSNASLIPDTQVITTALLIHAQQNNGAGPGHALQLTLTNNVAAANFVDWNRGGDEANVPVANMTLAQFEYLPRNKKFNAVKAATDALPAGTIAHRLGDFVFVHHGIDFNNADPQLWIVVMTPDPKGKGYVSGMPVGIGLANGTSFQLADLSGAALRSQNALRAKYGLAPLPDPRTVTHEQPFVAGMNPTDVPDDATTDPEPSGGDDEKPDGSDNEL